MIDIGLQGDYGRLILLLVGIFSLAAAVLAFVIAGAISRNLVTAVLNREARARFAARGRRKPTTQREGRCRRLAG
jgi:hypothetical protein